MELKKLTEVFYHENSGLTEVLDKVDGEWTPRKTRGYGIALIDFRKLRFGIPLRSHISHKHCFITSGSKGLDYSKAVLLMNDAYISEMPFKIPNEELTYIREKNAFICRQFGRYVDGYVRAVREGNHPVIAVRYRFTTLVNYHSELGV
ncbi:type III toxin-antitoxin system TenpIN family toxin [Martelella sp. AMO21009]